MSTAEPAPCRHEYVRIYQRRLKGLDRRLVMTRAYLPVGFKPADLGHLGEGSYCFCSKCRFRLHPKRTQAEKLAARVALAQGKAAEALAAELQEQQDQQEAAILQEVAETETEKVIDIHVEELELEAVDVQDIEAEGVKLSADEDETCNLTGEDV